MSFITLFYIVFHISLYGFITTNWFMVSSMHLVDIDNYTHIYKFFTKEQVQFNSFICCCGWMKMVLFHEKTWQSKNCLVTWVWASLKTFLSTGFYSLLRDLLQVISCSIKLWQVIHHEWTAIWSHCISAPENSVSIPQMQDLLQLFLK